MWAIILISLISARFTFCELIGDHVCSEENRYYVNVTQHFTRNATVRNYVWCLNVPPRCSTYFVKPINDTRIVEEERVELVEKCCPGFYEIGNKCRPKCSSCLHGTCMKNQQCDCKAGYQGKNCDTRCNNTKWGPNCKYDCTCTNGECDAVRGTCYCAPGWYGIRCEVPCAHGYYGANCTEKCECPTDDCNSVDGRCSEITIRIPDKFQNREGNIEVMGNLRMITNPWDVSYHRKPPTLQKYYTFDHTTASYAQSITTPKLIEDFNNAEEVSQESSTYNRNESVKQKNYDTTIRSLPAIEEVDATTSFEQKQVNITISRSITDDADTVSSWENGEDVIHNHPAQGLVYSIVAAVSVSFIIIFAAIAIVVAHRYKKKETNESTSDGAKMTVTGKGHSVSVYTRSVFHGALPELPTFNNPVFRTPVENNCENSGTFETHVVCSMNFSNSKRDTCNYLYDHPPSTGSYRAASIPEPPDTELNSLKSVSTNEPLYDEIPCCKRVLSANLSPPPYSNEDFSLYVNTTENSITSNSHP